MDTKTQAFLDKVASGEDRGVRSEGVFEVQLHAAMNMLFDPQVTWPARLRVRFDGPDLSQADKAVLLQLLLHVEDDCAAIVERAAFLKELQELDTDETWSAVKLSVARLMQSVVRMRHDSEVLEVRLVEEMSQPERSVLKVALSGTLLCALRGRVPGDVPLGSGRGQRVMKLHEVLAVVQQGQKKRVEGGWPYPFYVVGKPIRQLASGDWMIEIFGGGKPEGKGELSLRALLGDEDLE